MLEKAFTGSRLYWAFLAVLVCLIGLGACCYLWQFYVGLGLTGLSRDVPWGLYIAQFTFLVGVAASAVMVVLPYYLHDYRAFGRVVVLGEFLAIAAVTMCQLFIFVDMGQPRRLINALLHPTPNSIIFWDIVALGGYLALNVVITRVTFGAEGKGVAPPWWIKPVIILSIPWAFSIHTVTAMLYSGLGARPFWLSAIMTPRCLASAFSAGPALLILLCLLVRKLGRYDVGQAAISKLGEIITYAMIGNVFFWGLELFTALYSAIPEHVHHFEYLFFGLEGKSRLILFSWTSQILAVVALALLIVPAVRRIEPLLVIACIAVVGSIWLDKGLGMVVAGFVPSPLGHVTEYWPTLPELAISAGIYAIGALIVTLFYKMAIAV
ncbi:MAG: polysulfide reductase NrfD, partial [Candidatus Riflebacteria bacterium]|nr:polysulfide reductase NrfD [Candidatus Riflebacteria bacterium]